MELGWPLNHSSDQRPLLYHAHASTYILYTPPGAVPLPTVPGSPGGRGHFAGALLRPLRRAGALGRYVSV